MSRHTWLMSWTDLKALKRLQSFGCVLVEPSSTEYTQGSGIIEAKPRDSRSKLPPAQVASPKDR